MRFGKSAVAATTLALVATASPAAAAAPSWTAHTIAGHTYPANAASVTRIACVDKGFCVELHGGQFPDQISQLRGGRVQQTLDVPLPSDATDSASAWLVDVTCVTATNCTAVGGYSSSSSALAQPLAETFDGAAWTPTVVPIAGESAGFDEVACAADRCVAIASSRFGSHLLATTGGAWQEVSVTLPARVDSGTLSYGGLACAAAANCYLTMRATEIETGQPTSYFAYPSGSGFKAVRVPVLSQIDPTSVVLGPMSCPGPTDCTALGTATTIGGAQYLYALTLSAGALSARPFYTPFTFTAGTRVATAPYLDCPAVGRCAAAIGFDTATGQNTALFRLHNGYWLGRVAPKPADARASRTPVAVACAEPDVCAVAGTNASSDGAASSGVIWTYSGGAWSAVTPQRSGGLAYANSFLDDVDCSGPACYAAGSGQTTSSADKPLVAYGTLTA